MASTTIDDAALNFSGDWTHADDNSANLFDGTQSYTNAASASFSFSFTGTGFDMCAGLKADRGPFNYVVDSTSHGSGTELGISMDQDPTCSVVASVRNLAAGNHQVVFTNGGPGWFGVDSVTTYNDVAAVVATPSTTLTSQMTTSTTTSTSTSTSTLTSTVPALTTSSTSTSTRSSTSSAMITSITRASSGMAPSSSAQAAATSQNDSAHSQLSAGRKAAIVACPILAGGIVAGILFFLFMRWKRARQDRDGAIAPSSSSHYLDEKASEDDRYYGVAAGGLDMTEKRSAAGRMSPIQKITGRISPLGLGRSKGHNRLASDLSLVSNTEPFRPESLAQPPNVEPYYLDPNPQLRSSVAPPPGAALRPDSNYVPMPVYQGAHQHGYSNRLMAAASSLPNFAPQPPTRAATGAHDWRMSRQTATTSIYPETSYEVEDDRRSAHSDIYGGMHQ